MPVRSFDLETPSLQFQYGGRGGAGLKKNALGSSFKTAQTLPRTGWALDYTKRGWKKRRGLLVHFTHQTLTKCQWPHRTFKLRKPVFQGDKADTAIELWMAFLWAQENSLWTDTSLLGCLWLQWNGIRKSQLHFFHLKKKKKIREEGKKWGMTYKRYIWPEDTFWFCGHQLKYKRFLLEWGLKGWQEIKQPQKAVCLCEVLCWHQHGMWQLHWYPTGSYRFSLTLLAKDRPRPCKGNAQKVGVAAREACGIPGDVIALP